MTGDFTGMSIRISPPFVMSHELLGWELTEGRIPGMGVTSDPKVSEIIAALEAIRSDQKNPFVVLNAPATGDDYPNYCQALADEMGYVCEIRIFRGKEFRHMRAFLADAAGHSDASEEELANLGQAVRIFTGFIAEPTSFPPVDGLVWCDVSDEFEPVE